EEERGEIGQFFVPSKAFHGVLIFTVLFELFRRHQAGPGPFGGKRSRSDGVDPDVILGPLHSQRGGHGQYSRFGARRRHYEAGATIRCRVSGHNVQNISTEFLSDPPLAEYLSAVKGAIQDDANNGVERIGAELFRASNEIAGGIVHQRINSAKLQFGLSCSVFDGGIVADVARGVSGGATEPMNLLAGLAKRFLASADEKQARA